MTRVKKGIVLGEGRAGRPEGSPASEPRLIIRDDSAPAEKPGDPDLGDQLEIVATQAYVHLERMSDGNVWIGLQVGRRFLHINFYAAKKNFVVMHVEEEEHEAIGNVATE